MLFFPTSSILVLAFTLSVCTFLACSKNCLPISLISSTFFFCLSFLTGLICLGISSLARLNFLLALGTKDLSLANSSCFFSYERASSSSLFLYWSSINQSYFSLMCLTCWVMLIFYPSFLVCSYSNINFSSISLSLNSYFYIFLRVFSSTLANCSIFNWFSLLMAWISASICLSRSCLYLLSLSIA